MIDKELHFKIAKTFLDKNYKEAIDLIENNSSYENLNSQFLNILGASKLLLNFDNEKVLQIFEDGYNKEKKSRHAFDCFINFASLSNINKKPLKPSKYYDDVLNNFGYNEKLVEEIILTFALLNNPKKIVDILSLCEKNIGLNISNLQKMIYYNLFINFWNQNQIFEYSKMINNLIEPFQSDKLFPLNSRINKKVKIAFLSADIRAQHSVTKFLKTLFIGKQRKKYELVIISNLKTEDYDETTREFKLLADEWIEINNLDDLDGVNFIRKKNIDIVFDLMGFTAGNKIIYFKNRISKIQINWLGYTNTTGLNEMDYIIADKNLVYKNEEKFYSEKIIYLNKIWNCFTLDNGQIINTRNYPFKKNNYITFCSFNNFLKITEEVVDTWSEILKKVKNSKLILKSSMFQFNDDLLEKFKKNGVEKSIVFMKYTNSKNHVKMYEEADIALDTFPYNGVTTSFEAIMCGLPLITMKGKNFTSRCGESINKNLGFENFIAKDTNDYVSKSVSLANEQNLNKYKNNIFSKARSSPLYDDNSFRNDFFSKMDDLIRQ